MNDLSAHSVAQSKQQLADALRMMERAEVIDFNGHMSCRVPGTDHVLINSGKSVRSSLTAADIIAIDMDGKPVEGDVVPPMEFHIHTEIYRRRPDVNAVAHTHPVWSTLFSMTGQPVLPVTMQAAVMGPVRTFGKTASINQKALGEELAAALGADRVVMLKSHGAVIAGSDIVEAFVLAIYLEETARRQYLALPLGKPYTLTAEEVRTIGTNLRKPHLLRKVWDFHRAKLVN
ncbi:MAG TPA: class II aldolase/adducin family protein [Usitatibacter sp.]|jgi:L-fuculose-phosphate aldolase|nr:class II aldolase/adducin family protein [Usitatibacter sp.]